MFAGLNGINENIFVKLWRGADYNTFNFRIVQNILIISGCITNLMLCSQILKNFRINVCEPFNSGFICFLKVFYMMAADHSGTNYPDYMLIHYLRDYFFQSSTTP